MEKQELSFEERFSFLSRTYFGNLDDLYNAIGKRAFSDLARTVNYKDGVQKDEKDLKKEQINKIIGKGFAGLHIIKNQNEFNVWHNEICKTIINDYKPLTVDFHYGQAQKWVNMMAKYLLTISYYQFKHLIPFLHIPIDNNIYELAEDTLGIIKPNKPWSQLEEKDYVEYQGNLKDSIKESPIIWEYRNWGNYNKKKQTSKGLSKKDDNPINNQTFPILERRYGYDILAKEEVYLNEIPALLFVSYTGKEMKFFCELYLKQRDKNINNLPDVIAITKKIHLDNNYSWSENNTHRKYVIFETGIEGLNKAKKLMSQIIKVINTTNEK